jgi:hypothetical protein
MVVPTTDIFVLVFRQAVCITSVLVFRQPVCITSVLVFRQAVCITSVLVLPSNCLLGSMSTIRSVVSCRRSLSVLSTLHFLGKPQYQSVRYNCTAPLYRVYRQAVCCLQTGQFFQAHS